MHDYKSIISFFIFIRALIIFKCASLEGGTLHLAQRARQNERALWNFELTRNKHHFHFFVLVFLLNMSRCTFHLTQRPHKLERRNMLWDFEVLLLPANYKLAFTFTF